MREILGVTGMEILDKVSSHDGATKYLFGLDDGLRIESVFLRMEREGKESLCISSQVGCALACQFCSTGIIGYKRNLSAEEIAEQVFTVFRDLEFIPRRRFDLSYMGMGEPMLNLDAVLESKRILTTRYPRFSLHLSTVGIAPRIRELAERSPDFVLQISLHAPEDELREQIMPVNAAHNIQKVLGAAEHYAVRCGRPVTLNYCLMAGINDDIRLAHRLARLIGNRPFRVQLVNFNPHVAIRYQPTADDRVELFARILAEAGLRVHIREQLGRLQGAGCGQLDADYGAGQFHPVRNQARARAREDRSAAC
jgi:23S rRNA (adenine2503-C2)-methyltransferase